MPRQYVNNSSNRSLGRVGMPVGSMPVSRSSGSGRSTSRSGQTGTGNSNSSGSSTTVNMPQQYVNNLSNRSLGRVGMPVGSMPVSRSAGSGRSDTSCTSSSGQTGTGNSNSSGGNMGGETKKLYVDNAYNRRLGRVGMEHGAMVVSKATNMAAPRPDGKIYVDNPLNRRIERVGLPLGSKPYVRPPQAEFYSDNAFNRQKGRNGLPKGSKPISKKSNTTDHAKKIVDNFTRDPDCEIDFSGMDIDENQQDEACDIALNYINRTEEVFKWQEDNQTTDEPKTSEEVLQNYTGTKIDYAQLDLIKEIGSGGFGNVYFSEWKGTIVAVKKLRVQKMSNRKLKEFTDELLLLCKLDHRNIIKLVGGCVVIPNLCIVMEYMQMSLHEALHIKEVEYSDVERIKLIQHTIQGIKYLHDKDIAHCDLKSQNVLLEYLDEKKLLAKITDFGLSTMKSDTETSTSAGGEYVRTIGTPRYSAPENLKGELLDVSGLKMADIYSFSLIVFEVVYEEEPFPKLNYLQLMKQVGECGATPEIPSDILIENVILDLMRNCWEREPNKRPTADRCLEYSLQLNRIYTETEG